METNRGAAEQRLDSLHDPQTRSVRNHCPTVLQDFNIYSQHPHYYSASDNLVLVVGVSKLNRSKINEAQ